MRTHLSLAAALVMLFLLTVLANMNPCLRA